MCGICRDRGGVCGKASMHMIHVEFRLECVW